MSSDARNRLITALGLVALVLLSANIVTAVTHHVTSHRHDRHFVQHERKMCRNKVEVRVHTEANTLPIEVEIETRQAHALAELEAALAQLEAERTAIEMAQLQDLDQEQRRLEAERERLEAQYQRMMADLEQERAQREHAHAR